MSEAPEPILDDTEQWCAGLPLASIRSLLPHERNAIARRATLLTRGRQLVVGIGAVFAVVPVALCVTGGEALEKGFWPSVFVGWVFGLPLLMLVARDVSRARRAHVADLDEGRVLVFGDDAPVRAVEPRPTDDPEAPAQLRRLDVFCGSHTVLATDARGRLAFQRVRVRDVAHGPSYAMRVPLAPIATGDVDAPAITFLKRTLTEPERAEVLVYARRFARPNGVILFGLVLAAMAVVGLVAVARGAHWDGDTLGGLASLVVGVIAAWRYVQNLQIAQGLRRDVSTGWAITPSVGAPDGADAPESAASPADTEFLPHSLLVWTVGGSPAPWRDLSEDAQTNAPRG